MKLCRVWQVELSSGRTEYGNTKDEALAKARPGETVIGCFSERVHLSTPLKRIVSYRGSKVKRRW